MPVIKIRTAEQAIIDQIAQDADSIQRFGLQVQPSTPYATSMVPSSVYINGIAVGSAEQTKALDAIKANVSAMYRYVSPVYYEYTDQTPNHALSNDTYLMEEYLPFRLEVPRTVQVCASFSIEVSALLTTVWYVFEVNGVQTSTCRRYFETGGLRGVCSGTWIVDLPANVPINMKLHVFGSGAGQFRQTSNYDFTNLTFMG